MAGGPRTGDPDGTVTPEGALSAVLVARVFLPFAAGFFLSYVYRVVNAVIGPEIAGEIGLAAEHLGLLTSVYFLTFAAFQLPLGVLLDRFGPRRVEATLLLVAVAGAILFAASEGLGALVVARGLIGLGVSACLMAGFKAFVTWFPPGRLTLANGALVASGGAGAMAATAPAEAALDAIGWRGMFLVLAGLTFALAVAILLVVPEKPPAAPARWRDQVRGYGAVARDRVFWRHAPVLGLLHGGYIAIQSLWAGPWLRDVAGLGRDAAADVLLGLAAAMIVSALGVGWAGGRLARAGVPLGWVVMAGSAALVATETAIALGIGAATPALPWIVFGLCSGFAALIYTAVLRAFAPDMAGRASTALNLFLFVGAFAFQYAIGWIIDRVPGSTPAAYAPAAYTIAFGAVALLQAGAVVWFALGGRASGLRP